MRACMCACVVGGRWLPCVVGRRRLSDGLRGDTVEVSGGRGADGAEPAAGWRLSGEAVRWV